MANGQLTQKTIEGINQARDLALENSQQQLTPVHLAVVLLEDPEGLASQAVLKNANEETLRSILRVLKKKLVRVPPHSCNLPK